MGYELNGGYNYSGPIEVVATTFGEAAEQWYERYRYGGSHSIDGVYWPCFGDMDDDDYAVVNGCDEAMTRGEILAMMGDDG